MVEFFSGHEAGAGKIGREFPGAGLLYLCPWEVSDSRKGSLDPKKRERRKIGCCAWGSGQRGFLRLEDEDGTNLARGNPERDPRLVPQQRGLADYFGLIIEA